MTDDPTPTGATPDEGSPDDGSALFERLRSDLEGDRAQLGGQLEDLAPDESTVGFDDEGFADSGQVAAEVGEARTLAAQLKEQLDDVESALRRLDDGTYGSCEVCGQPIGESRLEAMPATRWCIEHAG